MCDLYRTDVIYTYAGVIYTCTGVTSSRIRAPCTGTGFIYAHTGLIYTHTGVTYALTGVVCTRIGTDDIYTRTGMQESRSVRG